MGGDHAPQSVVGGAALALDRFPSLSFTLFGDAAQLEPLLLDYPRLAPRCTITHTDVRVAAGDKPSTALRQAKNSSMRLALDAVQEGRAFGAVSAGNTGALMAMAKIVFKTLPGINRPAIVALMPTLKGECVMLDLGANVECGASDLFQFAVMGDAFARAVLGLEKPRIGLLNVGSEEVKGHDELKAAAQMLRCADLPLHFHGFIEGDDITKGSVDVVVTDGFTGNVALKTLEGTARMIVKYLSDAFRSSARAKAGYLLSRGAMARMKERLDPRRHNGAMFVGLNGIAIKSHGSADTYSFSNAIAVAVELAMHDINRRITDEMQHFLAAGTAAKPVVELAAAGVSESASTLSGAVVTGA